MAHSGDNQFPTDYNTLCSDLTIYHEMEAKEAKKRAKYEAEIQAIQVSPGDSWQHVFAAMTAIMMLLDTGASGVVSGQIAVTGQIMKVDGDITACGTALQGLTQDSSDKNEGRHALIHEASGLDQLLHLLTSPTTPAPTPSGSPTEANYQTWMSEALGGAGAGSTSASLYQQFLIVRQEIEYKKDPNAAIPGGGSYNPSGSYYFSTEKKDNPYLTSFTEMRTNMGEPGDPLNANEADQAMVNAFNTNETTSQSVNAALTQQETNETNAIKTWDSQGTGMAKSINTMESAATNNMMQVAG